MTSYQGDATLLKIGNGSSPESFIIIQGMKVTAFSLRSQSPAMNHVTQGGWQQYLPQSGMQSLRIEAAGRFSDSAAETSLRQQAFSGEIKNYQLVFGNGDSLTGSFKIQHYQRQGDYFSEETYRFTLESSGEVVYISE